MSAASYIYIVISILLIGFNIWQRYTIKYVGVRNVYVRIIWLLLAVLSGTVTLLYRQNIDTFVGGIFITIFFMTLVLWYPGLGEWGALTSLRQIQGYQSFTKFSIEETNDKISLVRLYCGDVLIATMKIKGQPEIINRFLNKKIQKEPKE